MTKKMISSENERTVDKKSLPKAYPLIQKEVTRNGEKLLVFDIVEDVKDGITLDEQQEIIIETLKASTGSDSQAFSDYLISLSANASLSQEASFKEYNAVIAAMYQLQPRDEIEGMLIAQLVNLNNIGMHFMSRAMKTDRVDFGDSFMNRSIKCCRQYAETLHALLKYRRKGEQTVRVEHIHVNQGGQAIVGNVNAGDGVNGKK